MLIILKTGFFYLWALYKRDLRNSTGGTHTEIIIIVNTFKPKKRQYLPHYWLDKGTVVNPVYPSLQWGWQKISLQSL